MVRDCYLNLLNHTEERKNLIEIKKLLKEPAWRKSFETMLAGDYKIFYDLLHHEDAKTRKNAALILGILAPQEALEVLYTAYTEESQLFVKAAYLEAIAQLDYRDCLPRLKERMDDLAQMAVPEESKKHVREELMQLRSMTEVMESTQKHRFTGYEVPSQLVLITARGFENVTEQQLHETGDLKTQCLIGGVMVKTANLTQVLKIRTYKSILFDFCSERTIKKDVESLAKAVIHSGLTKYLKERHQGALSWKFRVDIKSRMDLSERSKLAKRLSARIEELSAHQLVNSISDYEVELRVVENKTGSCGVFLKLYTLEDQRFNYRKYTLPTSIHPTRAALIMALAKPYFVEKAQVLDPFCGVGTMLLERHLALQAYTMYGVDIYKDAIEGARKNFEKAGMIAHFIQRDFRDFTHEYKFDELITNMPSSRSKNAKADIEALYEILFVQGQVLLKPQAVMMIYTGEPERITQQLNTHRRFKLEERFDFSKKTKETLMIIRYLG